MTDKTYNSVEEWRAEGKRIFGTDGPGKWATKCPSCGRKQTQKEFEQYKDKGATPQSFVTECIGRYTGGRKGPHKCDWCAYGLFRGPVLVRDGEDVIGAFDFFLPEDEK